MIMDCVVPVILYRYIVVLSVSSVGKLNMA